MQESKQRLIAITDGIMAIIMTIMVLNIPVPKGASAVEIKGLIDSILVFLISFTIVGIFWNMHRKLMEHVDKITNKVIWRTFLFLALLALIPIFAAWVTHDSDQTGAVVGYGIAYMLVTTAFYFLWFGTQPTPHKDAPQRDITFEWKMLFARIGMLTVVFVLVIGMAFFWPKVSIVLLMGFPIVSAVSNLWFEREQGEKAISFGAKVGLHVTRGAGKAVDAKRNSKRESGSGTKSTRTGEEL